MENVSLQKQNQESKDETKSNDILISSVQGKQSNTVLIHAKDKLSVLYCAVIFFMSQMWHDWRETFICNQNFLQNLLMKKLNPETHHLIQSISSVVPQICWEETCNSPLLFTHRVVRSHYISETKVYCILIKTLFLIPYMYCENQ